MSIENGGTSGSPEETPEETELATLREAYLERLTRPGQTFQMAAAFPQPDELSARYAQLSELKACLDSFRPLDPAQAAKLQQAFDVEYTYNSNKIEGNTLSLRETDLVVNKGLTIAGKPLREHLEAINHHEAIAFIRDLMTRNEELSPYTLCSEQAADSLRVLRTADPSATGPSKVRIEVRPGEFRPASPAGAAARGSVRRRRDSRPSSLTLVALTLFLMVNGFWAG